MNIREIMEEKERTELSEYAALAGDSRGREREEAQCDVRTVYQRDRDRILHSKAFRRLKDKTQVFLTPQGDHYRTRLTHTLEVSQIARTVAKALRLNVDLVEAISLGHDLGHTPFGHAGERVLAGLCPSGFAHNEQSVRVVQLIEKDGRGLNLTHEVLDGIRNHQMKTMPATLEGQVVRICDKIAYIHHDIDDAQRAGIITEDDIPVTIRASLGTTTRTRLNTMIHDLIQTSFEQAEIRLSSQVEEAMMTLRELMFRDVYTNPVAKSEEAKVKKLFEALYCHYDEHPEALPETFRTLIDQGEERGVVICDHISGMTDQYCIRMFESIFVPRAWDVL